MITLGTNFGGPEHFDTAVMSAGNIVAKAIWEAGDGPVGNWEGTRAGVNVVFYVPGSVQKHEGLNEVTVQRFSRKRNMVLVSAPFPQDIIYDLRRSLEYYFVVIRQACQLAAEVFRKKVGTSEFSLERAMAIIDRAEKSLGA